MSWSTYSLTCGLTATIVRSMADLSLGVFLSSRNLGIDLIGLSSLKPGTYLKVDFGFSVAFAVCGLRFLLIVRRTVTQQQCRLWPNFATHGRTAFASCLVPPSSTSSRTTQDRCCAKTLGVAISSPVDECGWLSNLASSAIDSRQGWIDVCLSAFCRSSCQINSLVSATSSVC